MRLAIYADVHANRPALDAVLEAVDAERVDARICLGDLVGYGAEPEACLERVRKAADVVVLGNHDRDVARGAAVAPGTVSMARVAQAWTRARLPQAELEYLAGLPNRVLGEGFVAVHGCYLNDDHVTGYVTTTMLGENLVALARRDGWPRVGLCGHTHLPMAGWLEEDGDADRYAEPKLRGPVRWPEDARAVLLNPGSVGQPRDGDPRAAYALVDLEARRYEVRRVEYDVEAAAAAIVREGLPGVLAERLREGR